MSDDRRAGRLEDSGLVGALAKAANMSNEEFLAAVKRQITAKRDEITVGDMIALFATAQQYGLNPLRKEVSLISTKQGPRVYVTFDGWLRVLVSHPQYISHRWTYNWSGGAPGAGTCDSVTFHIRRRCADNTVEEFQQTELLRECMQTGEYTPWNKWPSRMLAQKAAMQGTRFCFAMYEPDLDDVLQAESMETAREAAEKVAPSPGTVGPVAPIQSRALPQPTAPLTIDIPAARVAEPVTVGFRHAEGDANATVDAVKRGERAMCDDRPTLGALEPESRVACAIPVAGLFDDGATLKAPAPRSAPATLPGFDIEASRKLDAELAAREAGRPDDGGFDDLDLG